MNIARSTADVSIVNANGPGIWEVVAVRISL